MTNTDDLLAKDAAVFEEELEVNSGYLVDHVVDPNENFVLLDGVTLGTKGTESSVLVRLDSALR